MEEEGWTVSKLDAYDLAALESLRTALLRFRHGTLATRLPMLGSALDVMMYCERSKGCG